MDKRLVKNNIKKLKKEKDTATLYWFRS